MPRPFKSKDKNKTKRRDRGNALFKRVVYGRFPLSHLLGMATLAAAWPLRGRCCRG